MPQPSQYDVHIDAILTNISVAFIQDESYFVANKIFPVVPVQKQSDKYFKYTQGDWFRDEAQLRADATESAGSGYGLSTDNYSANVYAIHKDIGDQTRKNFDVPLDPDRDATLFLTQRMLQRFERQFVSDFFTTGIWGTDKTFAAGTTWDNETGSNPIDDIEFAKETILENTGYMPNKLLLGYQVFRKLKHHPDLVDRIKYTSERVITEQMLASLFGVEEVMVAKSVYNSANEGQTATFAFNFGKNALLCYSAPSPGILAPSAGYTFQWNGVSGNLGAPIAISRIRLENKKADRLEAEAAWVNKVVANTLGYFFSGAVS